MGRKEFMSETYKIRNELKNIVLTASVSTSVSNSYWVKKRNKINSLYDRFEEAWTDYLFSIQPLYEQERWKEIEEARKVRPLLKNIPFDEKVEESTNRQFYEEAVIDLHATVNDSRKPFLLLMRLLEANNKIEKRTIEAFLEEDEIQQIINEAENFPEARKTIIDKLIQQSKDGKFIIGINKNNKAIQYDIVKYAERIMRTQTRVLQTKGVLDAAKEVDSDLVQVSVHNTICPICVQYEGKIYSVSGTSRLFPPLEDTPPYHPYCKHSLTVTFIETLYDRGIEEYVDFSQGRSDVHPTARGWIPIAERNIKGAA